MTDLCTPHFHRVTDFMLRAKQECPLVPTMPTEKVRELRAKLILEEALETIKALGFAVRMESDNNLVQMSEIALDSCYKPDLVEVVDGCADISVVTVGTLIACGVKDEPVLECVDANNIMKLGPGHSWREDGKLLKPANHRPPDIDLVLRAQGWRSNHG